MTNKHVVEETKYFKKPHAKTLETVHTHTHTHFMFTK